MALRTYSYTLALASLLLTSSSFILPKKTFFTTPSLFVERDEAGNIKRDEEGNIIKSRFEYLLDPKPTKIPPELKDEIYQAEANTSVAKERQGRVRNYTILAVILVLAALVNLFTNELRNTILESSGTKPSFEDIGFGWVETNIPFQFFLTTKIGGAISLIGGAASGMMVEAEVDSQRDNAERIYQELERRREERANQPKKKTGSLQAPPKKKQSGSQKKRLAALSEVVIEEKNIEDKETPNVEGDPVGKDKVKEEEGLMGKLKGWYKEADSMAASQALMLNKELEDKGILEKITDETGLKVVGKEAAREAIKKKDESTEKD